MAPKYTTQIRDQNNRFLQASINLRPGDEILSEPSLAYLRISLHDFIDQAQLLNPDSLYCGKQSLQQMRDELPTAKRNKLDGLFNKHGPSGIVGIAATNCFTEEEEDGAYKHLPLRLYEKISRVNHSCQPNAIVSSNPKEEKAFLRALRPIAAGDEITTLYLPQESISLNGRTARRAELQQNFNFECECEVCSLENPERTANDRLRGQAQREYNSINQPYPEFTSNRHQNLLRTRKLDEAESLVHHLKQLEIVDTRLSGAHFKLAQLHRDMYIMAGNYTRANRTHCDGCRDNEGRKHHLNRAFQALTEALTIDIRAHGLGHPEVEQVSSALQEVVQDLGRA